MTKVEEEFAEALDENLCDAVNRTWRRFQGRIKKVHAETAENRMGKILTRVLRATLRYAKKGER